jgi:hypothetical protein
MSRRKVNLTLPEDLWAKLQARVPRRKISQYVAEVTAARLADEERAELRQRLAQQYRDRADEDLAHAEEFFVAEEEAGAPTGVQE